MQIPFFTKTQVMWAYDSLHLYRTFNYFNFKISIEYPQYNKLSETVQEQRRIEYEILMQRFKIWLDELDKDQMLTVNQGEVAFIIDCLTYGPFHFIKPNKVIPGQLLMLSVQYI